MPMDCSPFVLDVVGNLDLDPIAPIRLDSWAGELVVDQKALVLVESVGVARNLVDRPCVMPGYTSVGCVGVDVGILRAAIESASFLNDIDAPCIAAWFWTMLTSAVRPAHGLACGKGLLVKKCDK